MMAQHIQQIDQLENAIRQLLSQLNELRTSNTQLKEELLLCKAELNELKSVKKQAEQSNNFINIAQHIKEKGTDPDALKEQLARYLEYIDQCLELLNK